jgi:hypothetical protein
MDKSYPSKTPMVVRSLEIDKVQFRPKDEMKRYWDQKWHISVPLEC